MLFEGKLNGFAEGLRFHFVAASACLMQTAAILGAAKCRLFSPNSGSPAGWF